LPEAELYEVFNMGIGMTVIVAGDKADAVLKFIRAQSRRRDHRGRRSWQGCGAGDLSLCWLKNLAF